MLTPLSAHWATVNHILCSDFDACVHFILTPKLVSLSLSLKYSKIFVCEFLFVYYVFIPLEDKEMLLTWQVEP